VETLPAKGDVDRNLVHCAPHAAAPPAAAEGRGAIPDYLQPFIVEQEPSRYTAVDQAVWRFVLLQLHDRLLHAGHPSYARGLAASAISPDHIPSIQEIDRGLASLGWGAVCVDGFIPPRAFQAFQSLGVLPIAAEIRTPDHLPYTPAPDIIHEAAGHAPILIDPVYAAYVRAVGEVGARAFASPADARIDRAVRVLSELKETAADDALLAAAEIELERAVAAIGEPSEAARVARLYWWTAEYGLVGTPDDYRLYGAGLLSSLGESHFCHRPEVRKLPLSADCTRVGYDITRPQPQLFVARDFDHLHAVLADVSQTLAYDIGGSFAVQAALASGELCTLYFPGGVQAIGKLARVDGNEAPELVTFLPGAALAQRGQLAGRFSGELVVPLGKLAGGADPRRLLADAVTERDAAGRSILEYASGLRVSGTLCSGPWALPDAVLWLDDCRIEWRGRRWSPTGPYPLLLAERVVTAGAGSASPELSPLDPSESAAISGRPRPKVPKPKTMSASTARLERLYAEARSARQQGARGRSTLEAVQADLGVSHPHEWLLRWNVLDALIDLGLSNDPLARQLERQLRELEEYHRGQHPILLGLDYLAAKELAAKNLATREPRAL
jgi:phenylalanine-4-hydroxylase